MMDLLRTPSPERDPVRRSLLRDLAIVFIVTLTTALVSIRVELNESIFDHTRRWEHLQLDELPAVLLVLAAGLAWLAWRRYRDASAELARRREAEQWLQALLLDNRRLARRYLQAQESERKALARELHDELGQYLNAIKTDAVTIYERGGDQAACAHRSASIIRHVDHVYGVVRDLVRRLRPVALDDLGLKAALEHQLAQWQQQMPGVKLDASLEGDLDSLDEQINLTVYRLVQEGLTNVARHAGARRVEVRIRGPDFSGSGEVRVEIADDGRGAESSPRRSGLGLIGMRERVEMLGGCFETFTAPAQGFTIRARIPVERSCAAEEALS